MSQSPKSGQFNSDNRRYIMKKIDEVKSQSPKSGQFNSDPDTIIKEKPEVKSLNPLSRVNSILIHRLTAQKRAGTFCLNPLSRVNSILIK